MARNPSMDSISKHSSPRGAKVSTASHGQTFIAWQLHHRESCRKSLQSLLQSPFQSFLTWLVIAIALALPAGLYLGLKNLQHLGDGWQDSSQMSVFLQRGARSKAIADFETLLSENTDISAFDTISPANALAEFERLSGLGDVLSRLDENPLPTVIVIQPNVSLGASQQLELLRQQLAEHPLVDDVQLDLGWLKRLHEILSLGQRVVLCLAVLLFLGVLLIIGNTLRLAIENRRDEIVVTKMVGGTNGFVRRPFLYTGFWYGLGGGVLALLLIGLVGLWLSGPIARLLTLYESEYSLSWMSFSYSLLILLFAIFLGWIAAFISVARHLKQIEPR